MPVTATAVRRMHADRRHLGVIGGLHPLACQRDKLPIDPDPQKNSQFVRSRAEGPGLGEFGQFHHRRHVVDAEPDGFHAGNRTVRGRSDHLLSRLGKQNLELRGWGDGIGRKQHRQFGFRRERIECGET